ncbi:fungal-specific transcription factor domain-containing protein [Aspergillus unguis]
MSPQGQPLRQRKTTTERVRVTRACDRCKRRKIKCNNAQPCQFCIRARARCTFNAAYSRGRKSLGRSGFDASPNSPGQGPAYSAILPSPVSQQGRHTNNEQASAAPPQISPEPSQTDLQGHYIGPASGVSFLLRVQKRLHQAISFAQPSSIFTFGDTPLDIPEFDPSFCMMLPREDAQRLVDRYFDFAMPTYRFLHRPTVQEWFVEFYDTLGVMHDRQSAPAKVALLFTVFSLGRVYMPDHDRPGPEDLSTRYYLAAEHQLSKEKGSIRLTSVQARLTQCYYLLTQSRINHCWSLFGTVSHLALAIGLNRNRKTDPNGGGISQVEAESRRRTFWCAYTLDAYLSAALGRPRSFHDDDIDAELPACVDDEDLPSSPSSTSSYQAVHPAPPTPNVMIAPLAHMKIARIISRILRDLYSIKPIADSRRLSAVQSISRNLAAWRAELAWFLDADVLSTSLIMPIFQRQRNVLNLTYWHSIILTHRPFVLGSFAQLEQARLKVRSSPQIEESVSQCLQAAMRTVDIIDEIMRNRQLFRALWITSYFAFSATIMLYIHVIQSRAAPSGQYRTYLAAATRCQSHLSAIAEKGSLSERYWLVLEELRAEATRQMSCTIAVSDSQHTRNVDQDTRQTHAYHLPPAVLHPSSEYSPHTITTNYTDPMEDMGLEYTDSLGLETGLGLGLEMGPSGAEYPGWGQFTSMVSGLENIDFL